MISITQLKIGFDIFGIKYFDSNISIMLYKIKSFDMGSMSFLKRKYLLNFNLLKEINIFYSKCRFFAIVFKPKSTLCHR